MAAPIDTAVLQRIYGAPRDAGKLCLQCACLGHRCRPCRKRAYDRRHGVARVDALAALGGAGAGLLLALVLAL